MMSKPDGVAANERIWCGEFTSVDELPDTLTADSKLFGELGDAVVPNWFLDGETFSHIVLIHHPGFSDSNVDVSLLQSSKQSGYDVSQSLIHWAVSRNCDSHLSIAQTNTDSAE